MTEFKSMQPGVEVVGQVIGAFLDSFPPEVKPVGLEILEKHGIKDLAPGTYYPLQSFLDAMKAISDRFGSEMLGRIGERIATNAVLPPGLDSLEACLGSIDTAYHMNHRGGEIGRYLYSFEGTEKGLSRAKMVCPNPYPCTFDRGVIEGFAKRFKPPNCIDVLVRHDETKPCRRQGADSCTYVITWG